MLGRRLSNAADAASFRGNLVQRQVQMASIGLNCENFQRAEPRFRSRVCCADNIATDAGALTPRPRRAAAPSAISSAARGRMRRNLSRPWTESDFGDLQKMLFEGRSLAAIASRLRRSRSAVATKISHL